jgi:hypothetical protein
MGDFVEKEIKVNRAEVLRRQAQRLLEEAERWEKVPDEDVFPTGTVITFRKQYVRTMRANSKVYFYAAIKSNEEAWLTTGTQAHNNQYTWEELVVWLGDDVQTIQVVSKLRSLEEWYQDYLAEKAEEWYQDYQAKKAEEEDEEEEEDD